MGALLTDARLPYVVEEQAWPTRMLDAAVDLADRHLTNAVTGALDAADDLRRYARALGSFRDWLHDQVLAGVPGDPELRFYARTVDLAMAAMKGILVDWLPLRGYDAINHRDLGDWLAEHGAEIDRVDPQRNSAFLRGVYCGSFAFIEGDPKRPNMAAGRALQGAIRCLFHYNGSVLWRMQAGMGDAVIAPLYRVLQRRGVRFAFFHAADAVVPSADGTQVRAHRHGAPGGGARRVPAADQGQPRRPAAGVLARPPALRAAPRGRQRARAGRRLRARGRPAGRWRALQPARRARLRRGDPGRAAAGAGGDLRAAARERALRPRAAQLEHRGHPGRAALARPAARPRRARRRAGLALGPQLADEHVRRADRHLHGHEPPAAGRGLAGGRRSATSPTSAA